MPKTINFKLRVPPPTTTMKFQYLAGYLPFNRGYVETYPGDLLQVAKKARTVLQIRNTALRNANYVGNQKSDYQFARNCPPCSMLVKPWSRPCHQSWCLFCVMRKLERMFVKVNNFVKANDCAVVTIRRNFGYRVDEHRPIMFDSDGSLVGSVAEIVGEQQAYARQLRTLHLPDTIGGFHWMTIAPDTRRKAREIGVGRWLCRHSIVAVVPADWTTDAEDVWVTVNPPPYTLAKLCGNVFKYRLSWLYSDPVIMAEFLNCIRGTRLLNPFGYFKRVPINTN